MKKSKKSAMGYSNRDPEMGVMTLAMHKKAQHKPMMKLMKKGMRNRKMAGKGSDE